MSNSAISLWSMYVSGARQTAHAIETCRHACTREEKTQPDKGMCESNWTGRHALIHSGAGSRSCAGPSRGRQAGHAAEAVRCGAVRCGRAGDLLVPVDPRRLGVSVKAFFILPDPTQRDRHRPRPLLLFYHHLPAAFLLLFPFPSSNPRPFSRRLLLLLRIPDLLAGTLATPW